MTEDSTSNASRPTAALAARRCSIEERRRPAGVYASMSLPPSSKDSDEDDEDEDAHETSPLLPIFAAEQLDALPVYNITHTIRLLLLPRCETTLSWEQLRSPQVSQFLVKPIQQQIRTSHFSKATLYALMANCLQFGKEAHSNPGNSGVSKTRATLCELLAIRLLREFDTRELIDALSYDFFPLQGLTTNSAPVTPGPNWGDQKTKGQPRAARISALEVAIRAQAKRFLAHPLVVQQLEAVWAGTIVFHAAADNFHRAPVKVTPNQNRGYGLVAPGVRALQASPDALQPAKQRDHVEPSLVSVRRHVTLYNPKQASLLKLSRLRVPRYRQVLSTCSFAALLGLFVAVLVERSIDITPLEVIFWFWSAGFMLDEVVGFNEQGFSLYIMSFWNTFDLGILALLICYYCLRLYGILMPMGRKHAIAHMAYDLLAANAVLLFPRLFSVLDHYRYFSQLLIAFRMMAMDLVAVFVLIVVSCSGFFVAFTLSFGTEDTDAGAVAYALFQMLMGFTPAAWESWPTYNPLGKTILVLFLFICHFLIVTILITVLTNSFMAIVQNANEEHQFVFAVNAISMVKSDALFSYVAPTNIIAWLLAPLRLVLPFRQFVRVNRTVIKITHFPILFIIYAYERLVLRGTLFDTSDLLEPASSSPKLAHLREPSVATFQKDRALDEVFRRPYKTVQRDSVVKHWMQNMGPNDPPLEQNHSVVDRLETRQFSRSRPSYRTRRGRPLPRREITEASLSVVSDPENLPTRPAAFVAPQTDADDELVTNDDDDHITLDDNPGNENLPPARNIPRSDYFPSTGKTAPSPRKKAKAEPHQTHSRVPSTGTMLYDPPSPSVHATPKPISTGRRTPKRASVMVSHRVGARPILPARNVFQSTPNLAGLLGRRASLNLDLASDLGDNKAVAGGLVMPGSFATQMGFGAAAAHARRHAYVPGDGTEDEDETANHRMSKLMLARMNTLEESFRDVVREVKEMRLSRAPSLRLKTKQKTVDLRHTYDSGSIRES